MLKTSGGETTIPIETMIGETGRDSGSERYVLVERSGRPMATDVSVQIAAPAARRAEAMAAADACMAWFDEVDQCLSRFSPESDLSRLNAAAGEWFAASEMLYFCAVLAVNAAAASNGLFDPTMLKHLSALGYDRDFSLIAHREVSGTSGTDLPSPPTPSPARGGATAQADDPVIQMESPIDRAVWREIRFDPAGRRIRLPADAQLDLGGIAKGWAADVALASFCTKFPGALINIGGDLRARGGPQPGMLWSVGIRDPRRERDDSPESVPHLATVRLSRGAMATSGAVRRWWWRSGMRQHHLLDPRTGQPIPLWLEGDSEPATHIATVTAFAPTAAQAEVAAKLALLRGYPLALSAVESAWERYGALGPAHDPDAGVALFMVFGNGTTTHSRNLDAYLATWGTADAMLPMMVESPHGHVSLANFH